MTLIEYFQEARKRSPSKNDDDWQSVFISVIVENESMTYRTCTE